MQWDEEINRLVIRFIRKHCSEYGWLGGKLFSKLYDRPQGHRRLVIQEFLVHLNVQKVQIIKPISPQSGRSLSCKHNETDTTFFQILYDWRYQVVTAEDGNPLMCKKMDAEDNKN